MHRSKIENKRGLQIKDIGTILVDKLSIISYGLQNNNSLINSRIYQFLLIIESAFMCYMIFLSAINVNIKNTDQSNSMQIDIILSKGHLYSDIENSAPTEINIGIFITTFLMAVIFLTILKMSESFVKTEAQFLYKIMTVWIGLQRTILTFIIGYAAASSILVMQASNNISSAEVYLILSIIMTFGLISYAMTGVTSFALANFPLQLKQLPWNSKSSLQTLLTREILKVVIVCQDGYLSSFSDSTQIIYSGFLLLSVIGVQLVKPVQYFDMKVDKLQRVLSYIVVTVAFVSFFKILLKESLLHLIIFAPLIFYAIKSLSEKYEQVKREKLLLQMCQLKSVSPVDSLQCLQWIAQSFQKLNEGNNIEIEEIRELQSLHMSHRVMCFKEVCICRHYQYICFDSFYENEEKQNDNHEYMAFPSKQTLNNGIDDPHVGSQAYQSNGYIHPKKMNKALDVSGFQGSTSTSFPHIKVHFAANRQGPDHILDDKGMHDLHSNIGGSSHQNIGLTNDNQSWPLIPAITEMSLPNNDEVSLKLEDIFFKKYINEKHFDNVIQGLEKKARLVGFTEYSNKYLYREAIRQSNFKDSTEAKEYYYTQLLAAIIQDYLQEISSIQEQQQALTNWLDFRMLFSQIQDYYLDKPFNSIFNFLQIEQSSVRSSRNLGFLDRIKIKVCQHILIYQISQKLKTENQTSSDFSQYIQRTKKVSYLQIMYEKSALEIIKFWKIWNMLEPQIDTLMSIGRKVSQYIEKLNFLYAEFENKSEIYASDSKKYNLMTLFHYSLLNDPITANDMQLEVQNSFIFKNKNRKIQSSGSLSMNQNQSQEIGLCLVSATEGDLKQLRFIHVNKELSNILGAEDNQLQRLDIKSIMPQTIRINHDEIIKKFFEKGTSKLIGMERIVFVKLLQGIIIPVSFKLQFSYDTLNKFGFIGQFEKIDILQLSNDDTQGIPSKESMIILTNQDFEITEISQSVLNYCGFDSFKTWKESQDSRGRLFILSQIVENLDILFNNSNLDYAIPFKEKIVTLRRYKTLIDDFTNEDSFLGAITYIQEPFISDPKVLQHVFIIVPLQKHPDIESLLKIDTGSLFMERKSMNEIDLQQSRSQFKLQDSIQMLIAERRLSIISPQILFGHGELNKLPQISQTAGQPSQNIEQQNSEDFDLQSMSSSVKSSQSSGTESAYILKNYLFQNKSPKVLKLSALIIFAMLMSFIVISFYNLFAFLTNHEQISTRLFAYYQTAERMLSCRIVLLDLKMLHWLSINQQNHNNSVFNEQRLNRYKLKFQDDMLMSSQAILDYDKYKTKTKVDYDMNIMVHDIQHLSSLGTIYSQDILIRNLYSLFITYCQNLNVTELILQHPSINVTDYPSAKPLEIQNQSQIQRELYFIEQNGLFPMFEIASFQLNQVVLESQLQIEQSVNTLNLTTYISISLISIIMMTLAPIFFRLIKRQYQLFTFMQYLSKDSLDGIMQRCLDYQERLTEHIEMTKTGKKSPKKAMSLKKKQSVKNKNIELSFDLDTSTTKMKKHYNKSNNSKSIDQLHNDTTNSSHEDFEEHKQEEKVHHLADQMPVQDQTVNSELDLLKFKYVNSQISTAQIKIKFLIILIILISIGYLNSSLLVSQSMSNNIFDTNYDSTARMRNAFRRELCAYNILLFAREDYIQNKTMILKTYSNDRTYKLHASVPFYIQYCLDGERAISDDLRQLPDYLQSQGAFLQGLERSSLCNLTYNATDPLKAQECEKVYGGIMLTGFKSVMTYLISTITQLNIRFENDPASRTQKYLDDTLANERLSSVIDIILYYLGESFQAMQERVVFSINAFFIEAKALYILVFGCYLTLTFLLVLILSILGFRRMKASLLEIQNVLILMPMAELDPMQRAKIEQYLNQ